MIKSALSSAAALLLAAGAILGAGPAIATTAAPATPEKSKSQVAEQALNAEGVRALRDNMDRLGIEKSKQGPILEKFKRGVMPDSMSGVAPVRTTTTKSATETVIVHLFADGSVSRNTIESPRASETGTGIQPKSVDSCQQQVVDPWIYYTGCRVRTDQATMVIQFYADLRIGNGNGFYTTITRAYGVSGNAVGGSADDPGAEILRATQTASAPAQARGYMQLHYPLFSTTGSVTLSASYATLTDTSP